MDRRKALRRGALLLLFGLTGCETPLYTKGQTLPPLYKIRPGQYGSLKQAQEFDRTAPYITTKAEADALAESKSEEIYPPPQPSGLPLP